MSGGRPGSSPSNPAREEGSPKTTAENPPCKKLRSVHSRNHSFVRFVNSSQRRAKVIWISYTGHPVSYQEIGPGGFLDVNTFESHPWVFKDAATGDRMEIMGKEVFEPVMTTVQGPPRRKMYKIHLPVYRLEERCLQVVRDTMSPDQLERASLPSPLRREVQEAIEAKHTFLQPPQPPS